MIIESIDQMEKSSFAHVENLKRFELAEFHEEGNELTD